MNTRRSLAARQHGFTMLEVLISIVVIAFGMLGVAGLQAFALKNNQGASYRSVATVLATDLIDRMRANPVGATNGLYASGATQGTAAATSSCLTTGGCNAAALAGNDLAEWQALLAASLPSGAGYVCQDSTPNDGTGPADAQCTGNSTDAFVVKVWWIDDRSAANKEAKDANRRRSLFATEFQL